MFFEAIFQPSDDREYGAEAQQIVGKKVAIQDGWVVEKGPNKGQQGYYVPGSTIGLIPACDLKEIRSIPYVQWREIHDRTQIESS